MQSGPRTRSPPQLKERAQAFREVNYGARLQLKKKKKKNLNLTQPSSVSVTAELLLCLEEGRLRQPGKAKRANGGSEGDTRECVCHKSLAGAKRLRGCVCVCVAADASFLHMLKNAQKNWTSPRSCVCADVHICMRVLAHVRVSVGIIETMKPDWRPKSNSST